MKEIFWPFDCPTLRAFNVFMFIPLRPSIQNRKSKSITAYIRVWKMGDYLSNNNQIMTGDAENMYMGQKGRILFKIAWL